MSTESLEEAASLERPSREQPASGEAPFPDMVWIPGGTYWMGSDTHYPEEKPAHQATVTGFWMDTHLVTNARFARFVEATGYVTVAERPLELKDYPGVDPALLVPGALVFHQPERRVSLNDFSQWWAYVPGACWRHPEGLSSTWEGRARHPVVHVAYEDVEAYSTWAGKELPTEAEWERAARGGLDRKSYAWGDLLSPEGRMMANTWQGQFPMHNLLEDGYAGTSPVGAFPANGYCLFDIIGNVWEWTTDWYQDRHQGNRGKACCIPVNPRGPARPEGTEDPRTPQVMIPRRVLKGGSHLCAPNYCQRYRPAARSPQAVDTGASHIGFRCIVRRKSVTERVSENLSRKSVREFEQRGQVRPEEGRRREESGPSNHPGATGPRLLGTR